MREGEKLELLFNLVWLAYKRFVWMECRKLEFTRLVGIFGGFDKLMVGDGVEEGEGSDSDSSRLSGVEEGGQFLWSNG